MTTWKDYPNTSTPITAAALNDLENRATQALNKANAATENLNATTENLTTRTSALETKTAPLETTDWEPIQLGTGWTAIAGHEPRIRLLGGIVCIEGAVTRGSGGDLAAIATLPARYRSAPGTQFVGASVAVRSASTWAPLALYVAGGTGVLGCKGYTTIDGNVGWTVPISCTFARK